MDQYRGRNDEDVVFVGSEKSRFPRSHWKSLVELCYDSDTLMAGCTRRGSDG